MAITHISDVIMAVLMKCLRGSATRPRQIPEYAKKIGIWESNPVMASKEPYMASDDSTRRSTRELRDATL